MTIRQWMADHLHLMETLACLVLIIISTNLFTLISTSGFRYFHYSLLDWRICVCKNGYIGFGEEQTLVSGYFDDFGSYRCWNYRLLAGGCSAYFYLFVVQYA